MLRKVGVPILFLLSAALAAGAALLPERYLNPRPQNPLDWRPSGDVVRRWDPCQPIRLALDPSTVPEDGVEVISTVTAEITQASGLQFVVEVIEKSADDYDDGVVVVSWDLTLLRDQKLTQHTTMGMALTIPRDERLVDGWVLLHPDFWATAGRSAQLLLTRHEFGHLVGLGHAESPGQVLYPTLAGPWDGGWGEGDLAGLRAVGSECSM